MNYRSLVLTMFLAFIFPACKTQVKVKDRCGDGFLDPGEQCDGDLFVIRTCQELGFYEPAGQLACMEDCQVDASVCRLRCGDGVVSRMHGEECDGENLDGRTCASLGLGAGTLSCFENCRFDTSGCESNAVCGDGEVSSPFEACDGENLNGETCESQGYHDGLLRCAPDCKSFDISGCAAYGRCGDGQIQSMYGEECDGSALAGATCVSLGHYGGNLTCGTDCRYRLDDCEAVGKCGDGQIQSGFGEMCDGENLDGETCETLGFHGGELGCASDCSGFVLSSCEEAGRCGDGQIQTAFEVCDEGNLNGETCETLGFYGGELACVADCSAFDDTACIAVGRCGDGQIQSGFGEECDGTNLGGESCLGLGYHGGELSCATDCRFHLAPCEAVGWCGDGVLQDTWEDCDGSNLGGNSCRGQGYFSGVLGCNPGCEWEESLCHDVAKVSRGGQHTCALLTDGTVKCWGSNMFGQLGDGTNLFRETPVSVVGISNAVDISAGGQHTCAVLAGGTARCWGNGQNGRLGNGTTSHQNSPVNVFTLSTATQISAGGTHTCARVEDSTFWCWGNGDFGRLGDSTTLGRLAPVQVHSITNGTSVHAGWNHTCGLLADGAVRCWGYNMAGQLGDGSNTQRLTPVAATGITGAVSLSTGESHTCAVHSGGLARCWGSNSSGELGDGTTTGNNIPVTVQNLTGAVTISAGSRFTCASISDGTVRCWGLNNQGQLGDGTRINRHLPVEVSGLASVADISAENSASCARLANGHLRCWGRNNNVELGDGSILAQRVPAAVHELPEVQSVASGTDFTCAVQSGGQVMCFGDNEFGQLGDGTFIPRSVPAPVTGISSARQVAAGYHHACALLLDGSVWCWGYNESGQVGIGSWEIFITEPEMVPGLADVETLAAGGDSTCAVTNSGVAWCWGYNGSGNLGFDPVTMGILYTPEVSPDMAFATSMALHENHTCFVETTGTVWCMGANGQGNLGNGTLVSSHTAVQVSGLTGALNVSIGDGFSCATLGDGTVWCWGFNSSGQLGDGTTTRKLVPVQAMGVTGAEVVAAGKNFACAGRPSGSVWCWGYNLYGQLGDSAGENRSIPHGVSGMDGANGLAAGDFHACAILPDNSLSCWGHNLFGKAGAPFHHQRLIPAEVVP